MSGRPLLKLPKLNSRPSAASTIADRDPMPDYRIRVLHAHLIKTQQNRNSKAMSHVIKSYALSQSSLHKALFVLSEINNPALPVWNPIIRGLSQSDRPSDALHLFDQMRELGLRGDNLTFIFLCKACGRIPNVLYGKRSHVHILKLGFGSYLYVCNALIHMYGICGKLGFARKLFDEMPERDLVSWNSLICAFGQHEKYEEVLGIFGAMKVKNVKGDAVAMVKVISACNHLGNWKLVDSMVEYIDDNGIEMDMFLGNTLIDVYGKRGLTMLAWSVFNKMGKKNIVSWNAMMSAVARSGDLVSAKKLFGESPERDVVSWTCMISAYSQANHHEDAVRLFREMMKTNVTPDQFTIASVLSSCAKLGNLDMGIAVHDYITNSGMKPDIYIENALIYMYCKSGFVDKALMVFHNMKSMDSVSWTSVICGVAVNGESDHALGLFSDMLRKGIKPIHGTFIGVLLACTHSGLVEKGLGFFHSMWKDYGLVPEMRHYGCVVDLLCRAGELHRAYEFIKNMPVFPGVVVWRILLNGCKLHGEMALAKIASGKLLELQPNNGVGADYVLLSNSYANVGRWDDSMKMREMMEKQGDVLKPLGWSSIQTNEESENSLNFKQEQQCY